MRESRQVGTKTQVRIPKLQLALKPYRTQARKRALPNTGFEEAPNKCLQKAILTLAVHISANVQAVLLRMFKATCSNNAPSGVGSGMQSLANLYATKHGLQYIGAYVLIHLSPDGKNILKSDLSYCWLLGSKNAFCTGEIQWNNSTHHASPC